MLRTAALLVALIAVASARAHCIKHNTNLYGGDYQSYRSGNIDVCRDSCMREDVCVAFTFQGGNCWLKTPAHRPEGGCGLFFGGCQSARKSCLKPGHQVPRCYLSNKNLWAGDYRRYRCVGPNCGPKHCKESCMRENACVAFTYTGNTCWLKTARHNPESGCNGCISGHKSCFRRHGG